MSLGNFEFGIIANATRDIANSISGIGRILDGSKVVLVEKDSEGTRRFSVVDKAR